MNILYRLIILSIFCLNIVSCTTKLHFTETELEWLNVYNYGDTLVFQNLLNQKRDTTIITSKRIYHANHNWVNDGSHIKHVGRIGYINNHYSTDGYAKPELIEMYKNTDSYETSPLIKYLGTTYFVKEQNLESQKLNLKLTNKSFSKVYRFYKKKHRRHKPKNDIEPQTLFWDKDFGIIKYVTYNGEIWERIN